MFLHPAAGRTALAELLTPDYQQQATDEARKRGLFGGLPAEWVQQYVIHGLYPLHPLTARLLPRISNELAQSNRTMFSFLSQSQREAGGMQHFLQTQAPRRAAAPDDDRPALFTPDRLLDFFETNLAAREQGGETQAGTWLNDYRNAAGKVTGETSAERLLRNLLMLKIVRDKRLAPTADLLFYAQDVPRSQRRDFDSLLATLVAREYLDHDSTDGTYDFPTSGGLTALQAENEENRKLPPLTIDQCAALWQKVQRRPELVVKQLGTDRVLVPHLVHTPADVRPHLADLGSYYQGQADPTAPRALVLYLLPDAPDEAPALGLAADAAGPAAPYVLQAHPRDPAALAELRDKTRPLRVLQKVLARPEILPASPLRQRLETRLRVAENTLRTAIKEFFEPTQWRWHYGGGAAQEFTSKRKFEEWLEREVLTQFEQMPDVRDDALWFVSRNVRTGPRQQAFATIYAAPTNLLPLEKPGNAPADRVLENLLRPLSLQVTRANKNQIQYCEVCEPAKGTPEEAIFAHFSRLLKERDLVPAADLIRPLLAAPFGLSEHLVKFFFGLYNRLHDMQLTIRKGKVVPAMSLELLEAMFQRPAEYTVRRIPLSAPTRRYLLRLRELFKEQTATSFADIGRQFKGVQQLLSPLQRALLKRRGGQEAAFYETLAGLGTAPSEAEAQDLLLDTLPNALLGLTTREALLDDSDNLDKFIKRLGSLKELPVEVEREFQRETLRELGRGVFGVAVEGKEALQAAAQAWYAGLSSPKRIYPYENPHLNQWLLLLRDGPQGQDLTQWYLRELTETPVQDWADELAGRQAGLVKEFGHYKATVDAFTRPALPLLQRIARGAFGVIPAECASEAAFADLFRTWRAGLPLLTRQHPFADAAVAQLLDAMQSSAGTVPTFLEAIPRRWHDKGSLRTTLPGTWEDWSETTAKAVADEYERCVAAVNDWQPPVAEADFFSQLSAAFGLPAADTADHLLAALQADWLPALPERTRLAPWAGQATDEALLMKHLLPGSGNGGNLHRLFSQTLPERWQLGQLATMNDEAVRAFVAKVGALRQKIEAYRRPLTDLVPKLKRVKTDQYESLKDYQNTLTNALRDTAAFKHQAETDPTLTEAPETPARLLLTQLRNRVPLERLLPAFATASGLPPDQHFWTKDEEAQFVATWKKAQETLFNWQFPESRTLDSARQKLSAQVQALQTEFGLTPAQLGKLLHELLPQP